MTPAERVLGIPELLELILDYADNMDILCWQRVDRGWQSVIQNSPRIQDKIYLRFAVHEPMTSVSVNCRGAVNAYEWNPLIFQPGRFRLLDPFWTVILAPHDQDPGGESIKLSIKTLQDLRLGYAEASWKEIFVAKPPLQQAMFTWCDTDCQVIDFKTVCSEGGIKLKDLCQAHKQHLLRASETAPTVQWDGDGYLCIQLIP